MDGNALLLRGRSSSVMVITAPHVGGVLVASGVVHGKGCIVKSNDRAVTELSMVRKDKRGTATQQAKRPTL